MANQFGPTRGELLFRTAVSGFGLALLAVALILRGIPDGPALVEVVGVGAVFFGGTLAVSVWKLVRKDHP